MQEAAGTFGRLHILINMASIYLQKPFEDLTVADWDASATVDLRVTRRSPGEVQVSFAAMAAADSLVDDAIAMSLRAGLKISRVMVPPSPAKGSLLSSCTWIETSSLGLAMPSPPSLIQVAARVTSGKSKVTCWISDVALAPHGDAISLRARPINITVDRSGRYLVIAYNVPSSVSVHRINRDGTLGEEVKQAASLDCGIYAHQVRVLPDNKALILVTRGNNPAGGKPEDPGALKVKTFKEGQLTDRASVAENRPRAYNIRSPQSGLDDGPAPTGQRFCVIRPQRGELGEDANVWP